MAWNFGDLFETVARALPGDAQALIHGDRVTTWADLDHRSNNLARALLNLGAAPGDKVGFYMRNGPAYCETLTACFKARLTHANINYRYTPDEVHYILDNADATVVVFDAAFAGAIDAIRPRLTRIKIFVMVGGTAQGAIRDYELLASTGDGAPLAITRSPHDELFLYTGGTTGMPKGVIWRHDDLREAQLAGLRILGPVPETLDEVVAAIQAGAPRGRLLPACPLMHGTGLFTAMGVLSGGGTIVTLEGQSLDADELWRVAARHKVDRIAIVGDAFAKPMLAALDSAPGTYDLSSLIIIVSSGVMWSTEVKQGLLRHLPQAMMTDSFGSSEGVGFGSSMMTAAGTVETAKFKIGERCVVLDEQDQPIEPGSDKIGVIALKGPLPLGYYKDPDKTAKTFRTIGGERYSMPGDFCKVEVDGTLTLLGRGSVSINTGGEKVFPEEVEEALKTHPAIADALVVGIPDAQFGQAVVAAVTLNPGFAFDEAALKAHVRARLAGYKTPKRIALGRVPFRAPNGKADYKGVSKFLRQELGLEAA